MHASQKFFFSLLVNRKNRFSLLSSILAVTRRSPQNYYFFSALVVGIFFLLFTRHHNMPLHFTHVDWEKLCHQIHLKFPSSFNDILLWNNFLRLFSMRGSMERIRMGGQHNLSENWVNNLPLRNFMSCPDHHHHHHHAIWQMEIFISPSTFFPRKGKEEKHLEFHYFFWFHIMLICEGKTQKSQTYVKHKRCCPPTFTSDPLSLLCDE